MHQTDDHDVPFDAPIRMLFFRLMRAILHEPAPQEQMENLPLAQMRLMWTIYHSKEASMKDLAERLQVSQSTVTQAADKLVKRGLIERIADPVDRRVVRLKMSEGGGALIGESDAARREFLNEVWKSMPDSVRNSVTVGMIELAEHAERAREAAGHVLPDWGAPPTDAKGDDGSDTSAQPVVDLMSRRVRGR